MLVGFVENKKKSLFFKRKFQFLLFSRISGIRQNFWPNIRANQYPVQPYMIVPTVCDPLKISQWMSVSEGIFSEQGSCQKSYDTVSTDTKRYFTRNPLFEAISTPTEISIRIIVCNIFQFKCAVNRLLSPVT